MNMNREAVDTALGYAGNMPMTDADKMYKNLVYVFCKNLYLPALFNSLCEIDWRCARKEGLLHETERHHLKKPGEYYYEMPSDCIKPLFIDDNETGFRNDTRFLVTSRPARTLYYVFHNRSVEAQVIRASANQNERNNSLYISRPQDSFETGDARLVITRPHEDGVPSGPDGTPVAVDDYGVPLNDDDFPEWDYTPYDADFWAYFAYKFAAALVPKLRADDGAGARAQALEGIAASLGERVIARSRSAAANPQKKHKSWAEKCGLSVHGGAYATGGAAQAGAFYNGG